MASSYTDLGIEKMATGENAGTWGTKTNTNLDIIEKSIAGYVEQAVTSGGTTTLSITDGDATESTSVARHAVIKLTGTITGNSIVTVPDSVEKVYIVTNGTSGAYTVQFKTASGTGITFGVSEKTTRLVYSDGTNLVDAGFGGATDMEGRELVLDADGDTTITADTDDQIDIKIAGADDFQFTANTFTAQSGSTIAAQALTATTVTASGIVKTDDTTEATSTTDGSLQTDGGLSVAKDAVIGDDLKLLSDSAVLSFGADSDTTLTHTDGTGLTLNSTNKLLFGDTGTYIHQSADGVLDLVSDSEIEINATTIDINGAVAMDGAITGATNITLSGELDAATLDISGNADIDGTLEADAITINGTAIGSIYGAVAGSSSIVTTGALDSGSITSGFGNIDTGSSTITTTGLITGGSLDIDDVLINGTTIGHTDDTDLITLADGVATVAGEISVTTLDIGGTNVTATAAEINLIDGGTARGTTAVADGDGLLVNDAGTMRMTNVTTLKTYFQTGISSAADDISAGDSAVSITTSSGDITIDAAANNSDIIFKGTDATSDITMLTLDGSEAGAATFNDKVVATELDISGNCDIDGTTNLDAVDIDGAVQLDATLTIGANDQGYDVILYGDTASANVTWDTSADDLIFNGAAGLIVPDGQLTLGSTAVSSTAAELNLLDGVSGLVQADLTKLAAVDSTAAELNIVDGGTSATSTTVADADRVVLNDNGTMVQVAMTDIKTYIGGGTSWQAVKTGDFTASAGQGVFCNTTSAAFTLTLPASPSIGDEVTFVDYAGTFDTNNLTIGRNSQKIHGASEDLTVATERAANTLVFTDSTQGWLLKSK
jgi:cytoskeletal protein CcmA (bactofilin family)